MPKKAATPKTIRASKENARKAKKIVAKLVGKKELTDEDVWFLNEFVDRTIGKLPTEAAYAAQRERNRTKSK